MIKYYYPCLLFEDFQPMLSYTSMIPEFSYNFRYSTSQKNDNARTQKRYIMNKMKEMENHMNDFQGQTILEKMEDGVQYFTNPLKREEENSLNDIRSLNERLELLKTERKNLAKKKNQIIQRNRNKVERIKKLREQIEDDF